MPWTLGLFSLRQEREMPARNPSEKEKKLQISSEEPPPLPCIPLITSFWRSFLEEKGTVDDNVNPSNSASEDG